MTSNNIDHYTYDDNLTLINKFDIRDYELLSKFELLYSNMRIKELDSNPNILGTNFDLAYWEQLHYHIFQDIYGWAGEVRDIRIAKNQTMFAYPEFIETESNRLLTGLAEENYLRGSSLQEFSERSAYYFCEMNMIHPFREGNGRTLRQFFSELSNQAGYSIDWGAETPEKQLEAVIGGMYGSYDKMQEVFQTITKPEPKALELTPENLLCPKSVTFDSIGQEGNKLYFIDNDTHERLSIQMENLPKNNQGQFKKGTTYRLSTSIKERASLEWKIESTNKIRMEGECL